MSAAPEPRSGTADPAAAAQKGNRDTTRLEIVRELKAVPERVFAALTRAEELVRWFGPSPALAVTVEACDLRAGGRWQVNMRSPDGDCHGVGGVYLEVDPQKRIVMTWAWQSTPERESLVTIVLTPTAGGTRLHLIHERLADAPARDRHRGGWTASLERLAALLVSGP